MRFGMSIAERLMTRESTMNHCMLFCAVNIGPDGKPNRWKIENSWGEANGQNGFYVCSEEWFRQNVYQVTVKKAYLTDAQRELLALQPIPMKFWDPLA